MKLVVTYCNFGPYHVARARALARLAPVEPAFIEIADQQGSHPWHKDGKRQIEVHSLFQGAWESLPVRLVGDRLIAALEERKPDVVVTIGYGLPFMRRAAAWAVRTRRGSVLMHETARQDKKRLFWKEAIKRRIIRRLYHAALVGGKSHASYLAELGFPPERMWAPHSVVDNAWFAEKAEEARRQGPALRERLGLPERYFLFVGRLSPEKNVHRLLEAYGLYRSAAREGWGLVIIGDGPLRAELEHRARAWGLPEVLFGGFLPTEDVAPYYALAGCFVLPRLVEPWGLVVNEAMASSLPVLVSDRCGCVPDLVFEGNGFLFSPTDVDGLAALLMRVASMNPREREAMGLASREIIRRFSPEAWAQGLLAASRSAWLAVRGVRYAAPAMSEAGERR